MIGPVVLPGRDGVFELEVLDGRIESIDRSTASQGRLALPAFADLHLHADRAYREGSRRARSLDDAVILWQELRAGSSEREIAAGAERLLETALRHGTLRVRSHVAVDDPDGLTLRALLATRPKFVDRVDLELVAFAPAALDPASPHGARLLGEAVGLGADKLGAAVGFYADPRRSIDRLLDLAVALETDVDVHIDETLDPAAFLLEHLADATLARGLEGRVAASHCCALAAVDAEIAGRTIEKLAFARIVVISLPALNLYLQGRADVTPRARGLTLLRELVAAGVSVRFGSDNVGDVFYPYGDADPLESAFLAAIAGQLDDDEALLAGICDGTTRIEPGAPADLVLLDVDSFSRGLAVRPSGRTVIRAGRTISPAL